MKHAKATKTEVQTVMNRLSDKKKAEELKTQFYDHPIYGVRRFGCTAQNPRVL